MPGVTTLFAEAAYAEDHADGDLGIEVPGHERVEVVHRAHRAAVAAEEPAVHPSQWPHPQATPWLAWVRKHSIGPVTVSLMVSGQMPVILPLIVTETMPLGAGAACAVTPEIRLVFRPR